MLEVSIRYGGDVLAAEHAHLEILVLAGGEGCAAVLEVGEVLVDDLFGANVLGDVEAVALVGHEFGRRGEIDTAGRGWSAGNFPKGNHFVMKYVCPDD